MSNARNLALAATGVVLPFAGATAPAGWLLCAGQLVSRATYAALFAAIGTAYGAGDGSTTFGLPDLRGRVPAGKDNMGGTAANRLTTAGSGVNGATLGAVGGTETHTLTEAQMPAHSHRYNDAFNDNAVGGNVTGGGNQGRPASNAAAVSGASGNSQAHNNTQPTLVANYIIKA